MSQELYSKQSLHLLMDVTGYPMSSIEKTLRLLELLKAINADTFLEENLALKGGTAINVIHYREIPRLSVDLDFDLARNTSKLEMLEVKDEASSRIRKLAISLGYNLNDPRPNYVLHQLELIYKSATGNTEKIKLDINCLSRCHVFDTVVIEARNPFVLSDAFSVRMLSEYELFGAKLKALLERNTPRDIFDAYMLEQKGLYRDEKSISLIRKCIVYYLSLSRGIDISLALESILRRPIRDFKKQLFPMLKTGYGFVDRERMTSDAVNCVSRFLDFSEKEIEYLDRASAGSYCPELLFDRETVKRVTDNPAAKFFILKEVHNQDQ